MKIFTTAKEVQEFAKEQKRAGKIIGVTPTMGALHQGHFQLVKEAKKKCDVVITSVFVNPTQFAPGEDYDKYPRVFPQDCENLEKLGVDAVYHPAPEEMYPEGFSTYVTVTGHETQVLEGAARPIHFRGVATVVTKLFNLTMADEAFFGQKDLQQVCVVKRFVKDLNIPVHINMVPIVREDSGLARSSRNAYMTEEEHQKAPIIYQSLQQAQAAYDAGERSAAALVKTVEDKLHEEPAIDVEYVDLSTFPGLVKVEDQVEGPAAITLAVHLGKVRLIDNIILGDAE